MNSFPSWIRFPSPAYWRRETGCLSTRLIEPGYNGTSLLTWEDFYSKRWYRNISDRRDALVGTIGVCKSLWQRILELIPRKKYNPWEDD